MYEDDLCVLRQRNRDKYVFVQPFLNCSTNKWKGFAKRKHVKHLFETMVTPFFPVVTGDPDLQGVYIHKSVLPLFLKYFNDAVYERYMQSTQQLREAKTAIDEEAEADATEHEKLLRQQQQEQQRQEQQAIEEEEEEREMRERLLFDFRYEELMDPEKTDDEL